MSIERVKEKVSDSWIVFRLGELYNGVLTDSPSLVCIDERNEYCSALIELQQLRRRGSAAIALSLAVDSLFRDEDIEAVVEANEQFKKELSK